MYFVKQFHFLSFKLRTWLRTSHCQGESASWTLSLDLSGRDHTLSLPSLTNRCSTNSSPYLAKVASFICHVSLLSCTTISLWLALFSPPFLKIIYPAESTFCYCLKNIGKADWQLFKAKNWWFWNVSVILWAKLGRAFFYSYRDHDCWCAKWVIVLLTVNVPLYN